MLELLLGNNLLRRNHSRSLVAGSILGVAAVIVVLSLFTNYYRAVEQHLLGIHPHLRLTMEDLGEREMARVREALATEGETVERFAPALEAEVYARVSQVRSFPVVCVQEGEPACLDIATDPARASGYGPDELRDEIGFEVERSRVGSVTVRGLSVAGGRPVTDFPRLMDIRADGDMERLRMGPDENMPMALLFEREYFHGATRLDDFLVTLPGRAGSEEHFCRLLSTLDLGLRGGDRPLIVTSLESAQRLLGRSGANTVEVRLRDPSLAPAVAARLRETLAGSGIGVESWLERDAGSFRLLRVLRRVIFLVIFSVVVVAALAIVSTLSLSVLENRRKIAILKAMGLRNRSLYLALILKCWSIAALGVAAGLALGLAASKVLLLTPGFRDGLAKLGILRPEVVVAPRDVLVLTVAVLLLYLVVALVPARDACRIDPVQGLQS